MKAWQCMGCGRLEAQQTCIGICEDRPVELVYAADYEDLESLVRQLAFTSPRKGQWKPSYLALQRRARDLLARMRNG